MKGNSAGVAGRRWTASMVVACLVAAVWAAPLTIRNDSFWKDTSGKPLYSQGGGVFKFGSTWYWYGVHYAGAETYAANPVKLNSDTRFVAVTCYSSTDLVNWKFEGNVLDSNGTGLSGTTWMGRLGVAYNPTSRKYVLLSQHNGSSGNGELFATSSTPTGKFAFDHIQTTLPGVYNGMSGDQTVFVDDDGKAYLVCSSMSGRAYLYVAPLRASDYLNVETAVQIAKTPGREGNCMFKHRGRYFIASSDLHGWNASHTYLQSASSITGTYAAEFVLANTDMDFSHVSQTGFFFRLDGPKDTTVVFAGDRWSDFAGNGLGYNQWMPMSFNGTTPTLNSLTEWTLDAAIGKWAVGEDNNWVLNPGFEADRVVQTSLAGWKDSTNRPTFPGGNIAGGRTGRFALNFYDTQAFRAKMSQQIDGLPSASYDLSAWIRTGAGLKSAMLYARNASGKETSIALAGGVADWKQVSVSGIEVADGKLEVGLRIDGNAENWVRVDDFELVKKATTSTSPAARIPPGGMRIAPAFEPLFVGTGEVAEIFAPSGRLLGRVVGDGARRSLRDRGFAGSLLLVRMR